MTSSNGVTAPSSHTPSRPRRGGLNQQDHHHPVARPRRPPPSITTLGDAQPPRHHHPACRSTLFAEIGDCRGRYPDRDALAADAGQAAVAIESGKRKQPASAGPATSDCAVAFCHARGHQPPPEPWAQTSTPPPAPAVTTTPARSAPSAAAGAASCGAAGKTTPRTTRPPPRTATPRHCHYPNLVGPPARPQPPPSGWPAPPSPKGRPAGPSAKRLTASRHPLPHSRG